jgi:hypothetical protein
MKPFLALKAARELGLEPVMLNALYQLGLKSGHYRRAIQPPAWRDDLRLEPLFDLPDRARLLSILGATGLAELRATADEIVSGKFRQFGGDPLEIQLAPAAPHAHWTEFESGRLPLPTSDIKFTWEPARFGWAFTLGRAFHASGDERYAAAFWRYFDEFSAANPPYLGSNWMSGQEVGLRLMAFVWAGQVFAKAEVTTPARLAALAAATAVHAARIPATLLYARSQNNNHLLTESAALYTAALALPAHPDAAQWKETGWQWLTWCFENQIKKGGEYVQHSMNYHRLMLQTALWVYALARKTGGLTEVKFGKDRPTLVTPQAHARLTAATQWLLALTDPFSGRAANFGPNDGAYIFPFTNCPFDDYRPILQAAWLAFQAERPLESGPWDEMALWFGVLPAEDEFESRLPFLPYLPDHRRMVYMRNAPAAPAIASPRGYSWAHLRAAEFKSRPGHADLLHFDLWWRGLNITPDAGTYFYNAAPPWDNALTHASVHNTVTINGADQFTRAGRFLYLDFAGVKCATQFASSDRFNLWQGLSGQHSAYLARFGATHHRQVQVDRSETWTISDQVEFQARFNQVLRLHWLLPDWPYELSKDDLELRLHSPQGVIMLCLKSSEPAQVTLDRAGERLSGPGISEPTAGWVSPTYSVKIPALSLTVEVKSTKIKVEFESEFRFPEPNDDQPRLEALAAKIEHFAALIQSADPQTLPEEASDLPPALAEIAQKLRQGEIEALRQYLHISISPWFWEKSLGKEAVKILESVETDLWHFRLY